MNATAPTICCRRCAEESDRCSAWARSTATATPRSPASRRPAPSPWSWIATPPASSPTSPWSSSRSWPAAAISRSSTPRFRRPSPGSATRQSQIDDIVRYSRGTGTLRRLPAHQPRLAHGQGLHRGLLQRVESQLPAAFDLSFVFNRWTLGDDFVTGKLGIKAPKPEVRRQRPGLTC